MRIGGVTETAAELNISKQALAKLREHSDFPDPLGHLAGGPVWDLDSIVRWTSSRSRLGPGRPSSQVAQRRLGGRFDVEETAIGSGGFGAVHRAMDRKTGNVVAIKILKNSASSETHRRFLREARLLGRLQHPNVVTVLGSGEDHQGDPWYAMPLAVGNLEEELPALAGDEAGIIDVMRQLCAGLAYIHDAGALHRDLKPANVLRTGPSAWAIADFGFAHDAQRLTATLTESSMGFGSVFYAAPEQWQDARTVGMPADIFGLGKILHALAIGERPVDSNVPGGLFRHIILKATRPEPEQRYQTVAEFSTALEQAASARTAVAESFGVRIERLSERINSDIPDELVLREFLDLALTIGNKPEEIKDLISLVPRLAAKAVTLLWQRDPNGFRTMFERYNGEVLKRTDIEFSFCDTIANFYLRAIDTTNDPDVLRCTVFGLAEMGEHHNRWYVRGKLVELLQRITTREDALVALEGLQQAHRSAVSWSLGQFATRSLHPVLRAGVEALIS